MAKIIGYLDKRISNVSANRNLSSMFLSFGFDKNASLAKLVDVKQKVAIGLIKFNSFGNERIYSYKNPSDTSSASTIKIIVSGNIAHEDFVDEGKYLFDKYIFSKHIMSDTDNPEHLGIENNSKDPLVEFAKGLNGTFNIVIIDKDSTHIINDRHGIRPMYYCEISDKENVFVFASEIKALLKHESIQKNIGLDKIQKAFSLNKKIGAKKNSKKNDLVNEEEYIKEKIDWDFWKDYFSYGYSLGDKTPFKEIKIQPPATIISISNNDKGKDVSLKKYWRHEDITINNSRSVNETVNEGVEIIKKVFEKYSQMLTQDNKNGCSILLSGGYDSRCIACSLKEYSHLNSTNIKTYTSSKIIGKTTPDNDALIGIEISRRLGFDNNLILDWKDYYKKFFVKHVILSDGLCAENCWMLPMIEKMSVDVPNFDGIAGDVFLKAGYLAKPEWVKKEDIFHINRLNDSELSRILHKKLVKMSVTRSDINDYSKMFLGDIAILIGHANTPTYDSILEELRNILPSENKIKIFQMKNRMRNAIALAPNNMIMRKSFSFYPFLDNLFTEFGLSISLDIKARHDIYRKILDKSFPDIMTIPTTNDSKSLSDRLKSKLLKLRLDSVRYAIGNVRKHNSAFLKNKKFSKDILAGKVSELEAHLSDLDTVYLVELSKNLLYPEFFNKNIFLEKISQFDCKNVSLQRYIVSIMQFLVWYNVFVLGRKLS